MLHGLQITDQPLNITSLFALFVFLFCRRTSGAFTIDSSTPTLTINLNEHAIDAFIIESFTLKNHKLPLQIKLFTICLHLQYKNTVPNLSIVNVAFSIGAL
jgi:hypothetical protein